MILKKWEELKITDDFLICLKETVAFIPLRIDVFRRMICLWVMRL